MKVEKFIMDFLVANNDGYGNVKFLQLFQEVEIFMQNGNPFIKPFEIGSNNVIVPRIIQDTIQKWSARPLFERWKNYQN